MKFLLTMLLTGAFGVFAVCDLCSPSASATTSSAVTVAVASPAAPPRTVVLTVKGMTCGGCVIGTRTVLRRLPGVIKTDVSYEDSRATVTYDPEKATVAPMVKAIGTLGYKASVRSAPTAS